MLVIGQLGKEIVTEKGYFGKFLQKRLQDKNALNRMQVLASIAPLADEGLSDICNAQVFDVLKMALGDQIDEVR